MTNDPVLERLIFSAREKFALVASLAAFPVSFVTEMYLLGEFKEISFNHARDWAVYMAANNFPINNNIIVSLASGAVVAVIAGFMLRPRKLMIGNSGDASFANQKQVREMGLLGNTDGILLGKFEGKRLIMDKPLSVAAFAPPGMGKTAGLVIPSLLTLQGSVFVSDIKGELFEKTSKYRAGLGRLVKFSPGDADSARWNPLCEKHLSDDWNDVVSQVTRISAILYSVDGASGASLHFGLTARTMFTALALYLINRDGHTSIPGVREFALSQESPFIFLKVLGLKFIGAEMPMDEDGNYFTGVSAALEEIGDIKIPPALGQTAHRVASSQFREASSMQSTFNTPLDVFLDEHVAAAFSGVSDFTALDLKEGVVSVYNTVKEKDTERLAILTRVIIDTVLADLISLGNDLAHCRVTLVLDEFLRWGKIPSLIDSPAIQRGANVSSILIAQAGAQIADVYGPNALKKLKSTMSYFVIYCLNEFETAKDFSQQIGTVLEKRQSISKNASTDSISSSLEERPLVSTEDLMGMPEGEALILSARFMAHPIKAKQARYFEDAAMAEKIGEAAEAVYIDKLDLIEIKPAGHGMFPYG